MPPIDKIVFLQTEVIMVRGYFIDVAKIIYGQMTDRIIALTFMGGGELVFENADWQGEAVEPAMGHQLGDLDFKRLSAYIREKLKPMEEWP
jgi:predicted O-methyltransferase YrrM